MKFGFMYINRTEFRIDRMAKVLQVSQSGYYKWVRRIEAPLTEKEQEDQILKDKIFELFRQSRGSYGSRKITAQINKDSEKPINHKRIERAKLLSEDQSLSDEEIASRLGFSYKSSFYRVFSRVTGQTFAEYKKSKK